MSTDAPATPKTLVPTPTSPRRGLLGSSRSRALFIAGLIILGLVFLFGGDAWLTVIDVTLIAAIATLGLNVLSGYAGLAQRKDTIPSTEKSRVAETGEWIVQLFRAWGQPEKANAWQARLAKGSGDGVQTALK